MPTIQSPSYPADEFLRFEQLANEVGLDVRTIRMWASAGRFKVLRLSSRCCRVRRADWQAFLASRVV